MQTRLFRMELMHSCIYTEMVQFKGRDAALDWNALEEIENAFLSTAAANPASYLQLHFMPDFNWDTSLGIFNSISSRRVTTDCSKHFMLCLPT